MSGYNRVAQRRQQIERALGSARMETPPNGGRRAFRYSAGHLGLAAQTIGGYYHNRHYGID